MCICSTSLLFKCIYTWNLATSNVDNDIKIAIRSSFIYKMCCVGPRLITTAQFSLKLTTHLCTIKNDI